MWAHSNLLVELPRIYNKLLVFKQLWFVDLSPSYTHLANKHFSQLSTKCSTLYVKNQYKSKALKTVNELWYWSGTTTRECHLFSWYLESFFSKRISLQNFIMNAPQQTSAPFRIFSGKRQIGKFSILNLVILFSFWQKNSIYLLYNTDLLWIELFCFGRMGWDSQKDLQLFRR